MGYSFMKWDFQMSGGKKRSVGTELARTEAVTHLRFPLPDTDGMTRHRYGRTKGLGVRTGSSCSNRSRVSGVQLSKTGLMRSYRQPSPRLQMSAEASIVALVSCERAKSGVDILSTCAQATGDAG